MHMSMSFLVCLLLAVVHAAPDATCQPAGLPNGPLTPEQAKEFGWVATDWQCVAPCYNPGSSLWARAYENGTLRCAGDGQPTDGLGSCAWIANTKCEGTTKPALDFASGYTCRSYDQDWCGIARNQLENQLYPGSTGLMPCPGTTTTAAPLPTCSSIVSTSIVSTSIVSTTATEIKTTTTEIKTTTTSKPSGSIKLTCGFLVIVLFLF